MERSPSETPFFTVIVPVFNGAPTLGRCLEAIQASTCDDFELIVVDDGSTDGSADIAAEAGARTLSTSGRLGPGAARNLGAGEARGEYLFFIDADCSPAPGALQLAAESLRRTPQLDALFGSYDAAPSAPGLVSRFKNLQHHYVHHTSAREASTFWAGCGVIRRSVFQDLGGFDTERYPRPSIEDIELGYRVGEAGGKIRLMPEVQVTHHKAWTLAAVLRTDLIDRGIPWTRLLRERGRQGRDLNLDFKARASVVLALLMVAGLLLGVFWPRWLGLLVAAGLVLTLLNLGFYRFLSSRGGMPLLLGGMGLHWLYQLNCALAYGLGSLTSGRSRPRPS